MNKVIILFVLTAVLTGCNAPSKFTKVLLFDDFSSIRRGPYSVDVGAHTEYHYLHEAAPRSQWAVSTFTWESGFKRAWHVRQEGDDREMVQTFTNEPDNHSHPMVVAGEDDWKEYVTKVEFTPESKNLQSGIVFRYRNDRCYYFAGVIGDSLILKMVKHETAFHKPYEKVLGRAYLNWDANELLTITVDVRGSQLSCNVKDVRITAGDSTYANGKIGLMSDVPAKYHLVEVKTSAAELERIKISKEKYARELKSIRDAVPKMKLWKKIATPDFGGGRSLRFGDLNNDGQLDVLIGQVVNHGPQDANSELSCMTALTFDGKILWQTGVPDPWKTYLTSDVAFQIHDLDNDGKNEVIYCMNREIIVADGSTGKIKYKKPTPADILGDCLYFCDLRGTGYDRDIILKDRYEHVWALDDQLNLLWHKKLNTGHYPYAYDIDHDGKDELLIGYSMLDDNGSTIWSHDKELDEHADGVAVVKYPENADPVIVCAASDEGMLFVNRKGDILEHHRIGHAQNPVVANFRDDLPGLETVSINFWGNQGIIHYYDATGKIYHDFEPNQYGSMLLPLNWTGKSEEFFIHNANVDEGGVFDGWGRKVLEFPDDGHPDMCNAVLNIAGDVRDEIVVWDPNSIWIYTQENNPQSGRLYKPVRNKLYNYSNYQTTVSLPDWDK
ncbi:MAG TPA: lipoprotein [Chitinophagaceae bacterium]|nr:lipoprotein [Chitinophagaceae bacterium]